ncbi:hypothetical protein [Bacillus sp. FJAT-27251]|nr:hypothetical protein [Bacillus sp. FJAT-27251]
MKKENGIQVAIDKRIGEEAEQYTLEYDEVNDGLVVLGGSSC